MTGKFKWTREIPPAPEWFDFDRSKKTMDEQLQKVVMRAKINGWKIEQVEVIPGTVGYQLKNPEGEYVQFGGDEEKVWMMAYHNGLLPAPEEQ